MKFKLSLFSVLALVLVSSSGRAQQLDIISPVAAPTDTRNLVVYNVAVSGLKALLKHKGYGDDIFIQQYKIREATAADGDQQCKDTTTEKLYVASVLWRWNQSTMHGLKFYVCTSSALDAKDYVLGVVPKSDVEYREPNEKYIMIIGSKDPKSPAHAYMEVGEDGNVDGTLQACLPDGYTVIGWTRPTQWNANPPGVSKITDAGTRDANKRCVDVKVHVEGHGHDVAFGIVNHKGGGSVGYDIVLWGTTVDNSEVEIAKP